MALSDRFSGINNIIYVSGNMANTDISDVVALGATVDTDKTFVIPAGVEVIAVTNQEDIHARNSLSATQLTFSRGSGTAGDNINYYAWVVEFK